METQPNIGVFIPTAGRKTIVRTLHSILTQRLLKGDDIVVIGDGYNAWTDKVVSDLGPPFRYIAIPETKDWGHSQCNYGMQIVNGDVAVAQDDDDIFAPRAFEEIRQAAIEFPDTPIMARVKTPFLGVLWKEANYGLIDGHCLIYPNNKEKLGSWTAAYDGDQHYMRTTVDHYEAVGWLDKVISITRPTWKLWNVPVSRKSIETLRTIRNSCREFMTRHREEISWVQQLLWWKNLDQKNNWYWLFRNEIEDVGFVGLNRRDGKMYATYGLLPQWRGQGLGKELVEFSQWAAQGELTIEVLSSNTRALQLYRSSGLKPHWNRDGIQEMYSEWPPSQTPPREQ